MTYDHWKTTNPEDKCLDPEAPLPYLNFACPDPDFCTGNGICRWECYLDPDADLVGIE